MSHHPRSSLRFGTLTIEYDEQVLVPRPWTELQSQWAAELLAEAGPGPVLELCCGAGHIGLLAAVLADRDLVAVDLNPAACDFTRHNAIGAQHEHRTEVREGRLEEVVRPGERFALVIADPPWVPSDDVGRFPEDPSLAIDGGDDGLSLARACLAAAQGHLPPGGSVLLQLGDDAQAAALLAEPAVVDAGWTAGGRRTGTGGVVQQLLTP
jgi:release factor glutamine methyltransferase